MKTLRFLWLSLLAVVLGTTGAQAQIGYQISLLNTATGEARANEKVVVTVTLSNNAGEAFYSETKQATTNDFGVLSLSIGNADTFANVDFSKMPFYIEVSANGVNIGKSQILSVPVAEYAKRTGELTKEMLVGTWVCEHDGCSENVGSDWVDDVDGGHEEKYKYMSYYQIRSKWVFNADGTCKKSEWHKDWSVGYRNGDSNIENSREEEYNYTIDGDFVVISKDGDYGTSYGFSITYHTPYYYGETLELKYLPFWGVLKSASDGYVKQE